MTKITFEIHNLTTNELLADNLNFVDMPELLSAYQQFYPKHFIEASYRVVKVTEQVRYIPRQQFKLDWFELLDDIVENLER